MEIPVYSTTQTHPDFAQELAERIMREFNANLCAFMSRAVHRRQAAEFQRRYDETRRQQGVAA
jgi:hypothetical protein